MTTQVMCECSGCLCKLVCVVLEMLLPHPPLRSPGPHGDYESSRLHHQICSHNLNIFCSLKAAAEGKTVTFAGRGVRGAKNS